MLQRRSIIAGKCYVNNTRTIAREVLGTSDQTVIFHTYHLNSGNSCGSPSECMKQDFIRWADHEADSVELTKLKTRKMDTL